LGDLVSASSTQARLDGDREQARPRRRPVTSALQLNRLSGLYLLGALILLFGLWIPGTFLSHATFESIIADQSIALILAIGVLVSLAAGQFDLSAAQTLGYAAVLMAWMTGNMGIDTPLAVVLTLAACLVVGLVNGLLVAWVGINSFIATLGTSSILLSVTSLVSKDQYVGPVPDGFRKITSGDFLGLPVVVVYVAVVAVVVWYALEHTPVGRRVSATGASIDTARLVGVPTRRYVVGALLVTSFLAGIAGLLLASRIGSLSSTIGPSYLLPAFAGCFLGTTQLKPGRFNVGGTVLSLYLLATGVKGFQLASGENWITYMFNGAALILAVGSAVVFERRRTHST
jgi:ribose transport system permease protein